MLFFFEGSDLYATMDLVIIREARKEKTPSLFERGKLED
jgi:hypothetical protein